MQNTSAKKHSLFKHYKKPIALLVCLCLLPAGVSAAPNPEMTRLTLPGLSARVGQAQEFWQGQNGKTIYLIRDAHDSVAAQKNIARVIHALVQNQGVTTVFEEGYEGEVPTDLFFQDVQDPKTRERVSLKLLQELRIGGAEYAHINRLNAAARRSLPVSREKKHILQAASDENRETNDFRLIGADSLRGHLKNILDYQHAAHAREAVLQDLDMIRKEQDRIIGRLFPAEARRWLKLKDRFEADQLDLKEYLGRSVQIYLREHRPSVFGAQYPQLTLFLKALESKNAEMIQRARNIRGREFNDELRTLETELSKQFLKDPLLERVFADYQTVQLARKLALLELSPSDFTSVQTLLVEFKTQSFAKFAAAQNSKTVVLSRRWEKKIKRAVQFYQTALSREESVAQQLKKFAGQMDETRAALVFGGFHAPQLKEILREQGYSYVIVDPVMTKISKKEKELYRDLMAGDARLQTLPPSLSKLSRAMSDFEWVAAGLATITSVRRGIAERAYFESRNAEPRRVRQEILQIAESEGAGADAPAHVSDLRTRRSEVRAGADAPAHVSNLRTGRSEVRAGADAPAHVSNLRTGRSEVRADGEVDWGVIEEAAAPRLRWWMWFGAIAISFSATSWAVPRIKGFIVNRLERSAIIAVEAPERSVDHSGFSPYSYYVVVGADKKPIRYVLESIDLKTRTVKLWVTGLDLAASQRESVRSTILVQEGRPFVVGSKNPRVFSVLKMIDEHRAQISIEAPGTNIMSGEHYSSALNRSEVRHPQAKLIAGPYIGEYHDVGRWLVSQMEPDDHYDLMPFAFAAHEKLETIANLTRQVNSALMPWQMDQPSMAMASVWQEGDQKRAYMLAGEHAWAKSPEKGGETLVYHRVRETPRSNLAVTRLIEKHGFYQLPWRYTFYKSWEEIPDLEAHDVILALKVPNEHLLFYEGLGKGWNNIYALDRSLGLGAKLPSDVEAFYDKSERKAAGVELLRKAVLLRGSKAGFLVHLPAAWLDREKTLEINRVRVDDRWIRLPWQRKIFSQRTFQDLQQIFSEPNLVNTSELRGSVRSEVREAIGPVAQGDPLLAPKDFLARGLIRKDIEALVKIESLALLSENKKWSQEDFLKQINHRHVGSFVIADAVTDEVFGFVIYKLHGSFIQILRLGIDPRLNQWHEMIFDGLMTEVEGRLADLKGTALLVEVPAKSSASRHWIQSYERHGFKGVELAVGEAETKFMISQTEMTLFAGFSLTELLDQFNHLLPLSHGESGRGGLGVLLDIFLEVLKDLKDAGFENEAIHSLLSETSQNSQGHFFESLQGLEYVFHRLKRKPGAHPEALVQMLFSIAERDAFLPVYRPSDSSRPGINPARAGSFLDFIEFLERDFKGTQALEHSFEMLHDIALLPAEQYYTAMGQLLWDGEGFGLSLETPGDILEGSLEGQLAIDVTAGTTELPGRLLPAGISPADLGPTLVLVNLSNQQKMGLGAEWKVTPQTRALLRILRKRIFFPPRLRDQLNERDDEQVEGLINRVRKLLAVINAMRSPDRQQVIHKRATLKDQGAVLLSLEMLLPGSIGFMEGLVRAGNDQLSLLRFIEAKKIFLDSPRMTLALGALLERIQMARGRRQFNPDISSYFKVLDAFSWGSAAEESARVFERITQDQLNAMKVTDLLALPKQLPEQLTVAQLAYLARMVGVPEADAILQHIDRVLNRLDLAMIPRLQMAAETIGSRSREKLNLFLAAVRATLEGRYQSFIEDEKQADALGRALAAHNRQLRKIAENKKVSVERWLGWSPDHKLGAENLIYTPRVDVQSATAEGITQARAAMQDSLERVAALPLDEVVRETMRERLRSVELSFVQREGQHSAGLVDGSLTANQDGLDALRSWALIQRDQATELPVTDTPTLEAWNDLLDSLEILQKRLLAGGPAKSASTQVSRFQLSVFERNPGRDLFIGDHASCCLAMNSILFPQAMIERLTDEGMSVITVTDVTTGQLMAAAWLYLAADGSLVVQNLEIDNSYRVDSALEDALGDGMLAYALKLGKFIGAKRTLVGMPGHGKFFGGESSYVGRREAEGRLKRVPFGLKKMGGYFQEDYYLTSAGKPEAYLIDESSFVLKSASVQAEDERSEVRAGSREPAHVSNLRTGRSEVRADGIRRDQWILSREGIAVDEMAARVKARAGQGERPAQIPWEQITQLIDNGFERLRAYTNKAEDAWAKTSLPKLLVDLESARVRLYRLRDEHKIFVIAPIVHHKRDYALGFATEEALYSATEDLELNASLLAEYLLRLSELLEKDGGYASVYTHLFPENKDRRRFLLHDYFKEFVNSQSALHHGRDTHAEMAVLQKAMAEPTDVYFVDRGSVQGHRPDSELERFLREQPQAILYGDFSALETLNRSTAEMADVTVIADRQAGLAASWNVPKAFKVWLEQALERTQRDHVRVSLRALLELWFLHEEGYPEMTGLLEQLIQTASEPEAKLTMTYAVFKNLLQGAHSQFLKEEEDEAPDLAEKQYYERTLWPRVLRRHAGEGLEALFRQALLDDPSQAEQILSLFEMLFPLQYYARESFIWAKSLWNFYVASENSPAETDFFRRLFVQAQKKHYQIDDLLPRLMSSALKGSDKERESRVLVIFYEADWGESMREDIFEMISLIPSRRAKASAYAYFHTLFFGTDVEQTHRGSDRTDPGISLFGPGFHEGQAYALAMRELRIAAGAGAVDLDGQLIWASRELDDGAMVPGDRGRTWFSRYREDIHRAFSRDQWTTVQRVLEFLNTGDDKILKNKSGGFETTFAYSFPAVKIKSYRTVLRQTLARLAAEGHLSSAEGALFLTELVRIPTAVILQTLKDANPDGDLKDVRKVEMLLILHLTFSEKFGVVIFRVLEELKRAKNKINRWPLGAHQSRFQGTYQRMVRGINKNKKSRAFRAMTELREILRLRFQAKALAGSSPRDINLQSMLGVERTLRELGYEWLPEQEQEVLQVLDAGRFDQAARLTAVMGRFIYTNGFGGADFRDLLRELERGFLSMSQLRDLTRALLNETHKARKTLDVEMREALDLVRPRLYNPALLTPEIRERVKTRKEKFVESFPDGSHEYEVEVISEASRSELENWAVDRFIRKSGLPILEEVLSKWEKTLRDSELMKQTEKIRESRAIKSLDDYFLRFGQGQMQTQPGSRGTELEEPARPRLLSLWSRKGLNLLRMAKKGVEIPPGVITSAVLTFQPEIRRSPAFKSKVSEEVERLRQFSRFPDLKLLIYARSGSAFMMPGLMMTIPNLGMNDREAADLAEDTGDEWFAYDTYGELLRSFGIHIFGIPETEFQEVFDVYKKDEATGAQMKQAVEGYKQLLGKHGKMLPESLIDQVMLAIENVYGSWDSETARNYRARHELSDDWGTVVILQKGIFGNLKAGEGNDISGVGAATLRQLPEGSDSVQGKFRIRAIGEQLMTRAENYRLLGRSQRIADEVTFEDQYPDLFHQLNKQAQKLKQLFGYTQLFEFVIERGHLWVTQSNDDYQTDDFSEIAETDERPLGRGHGVSGGAVRGWAATTLESARALLKQFQNEKPEGIDGVILLVDRVNPEFVSEIPQGVHLIAKTLSIHAETLAQTNGITAVYGLNDMERDDADVWHIGPHAIVEGTVLTIDGHDNPLVYHDSGKVFLGSLPLKPAARAEVRTVAAPDIQAVSMIEPKYAATLEPAEDGRVEIQFSLEVSPQQESLSLQDLLRTLGLKAFLRYSYVDDQGQTSSWSTPDTDLALEMDSQTTSSLISQFRGRYKITARFVPPLDAARLNFNIRLESAAGTYWLRNGTVDNNWQINMAGPSPRWLITQDYSTSNHARPEALRLEERMEYSEAGQRWREGHFLSYLRRRDVVGRSIAGHFSRWRGVKGYYVYQLGRSSTEGKYIRLLKLAGSADQPKAYAMMFNDFRGRLRDRTAILHLAGDHPARLAEYEKLGFRVSRIEDLYGAGYPGYRLVASLRSDLELAGIFEAADRDAFLDYWTYEAVQQLEPLGLLSSSEGRLPENESRLITEIRGTLEALLKYREQAFRKDPGSLMGLFHVLRLISNKNADLTTPEIEKHRPDLTALVLAMLKENTLAAGSNAESVLIPFSTRFYRLAMQIDPGDEQAQKNAFLDALVRPYVLRMTQWIAEGKLSNAELSELWTYRNGAMTLLGRWFEKKVFSLADFQSYVWQAPPEERPHALRLLSKVFYQLGVMDTALRIQAEDTFWNMLPQNQQAKDAGVFRLDPPEPTGKFRRKKGQARIRLYPARIREVPYAVTHLMRGVLDGAREIALFPVYDERLKPAMIRTDHVLDALQYVRFYDISLNGSKAFLVGDRQADLYHDLAEKVEPKGFYDDWRWVQDVVLEYYARREGASMIVMPTAADVKKRWPEIGEKFVKFAYDTDMPLHGWKIESLPDIRWEGGIDLKEGWVMRLDQDPLKLAQLEDIIKPQSPILRRSELRLLEGNNVSLNGLSKEKPSERFSAAPHTARAEVRSAAIAEANQLRFLDPAKKQRRIAVVGGFGDSFKGAHRTVISFKKMDEAVAAFEARQKSLNDFYDLVVIRDRSLRSDPIWSNYVLKRLREMNYRGPVILQADMHDPDFNVRYGHFYQKAFTHGILVSGRGYENTVLLHDHEPLQISDNSLIYTALMTRLQRGEKLDIRMFMEALGFDRRRQFKAGNITELRVNTAWLKTRPDLSGASTRELLEQVFHRPAGEQIRMMEVAGSGSFLQDMVSSDLKPLVQTAWALDNVHLNRLNLEGLEDASGKLGLELVANQSAEEAALASAVAGRKFELIVTNAPQPNPVNFPKIANEIGLLAADEAVVFLRLHWDDQRRDEWFGRLLAPWGFIPMGVITKPPTDYPSTKYIKGDRSDKHIFVFVKTKATGPTFGPASEPEAGSLQNTVSAEGILPIVIDRGFGDFTVMSEGREISGRRLELSQDADVSIYFNVKTDQAIVHPEKVIRARAYYEKNPGNWVHDLPLTLYDDFNNGVYRFGVSLPAGFSGRLTFQYSVDGGSKWRWANHGLTENYEIVRAETSRAEIRPASAEAAVTQWERLGRLLNRWRQPIFLGLAIGVDIYFFEAIQQNVAEGIKNPWVLAGWVFSGIALILGMALGFALTILAGIQWLNIDEGKIFRWLHGDSVTHGVNDAFQYFASWKVYLSGLFSVLHEEIIFTGTLLPLMAATMGKPLEILGATPLSMDGVLAVAIVMTAFIVSSVHPGQNRISFIYRMLFSGGMLLLYSWSGSILASLIVHALFDLNAFMRIQSFAKKEKIEVPGKSFAMEREPDEKEGQRSEVRYAVSEKSMETWGRVKREVPAGQPKRVSRQKSFRPEPLFRKVLIDYQDLAQNFTGKNHRRLEELAVLAGRYPQVRFNIYRSDYDEAHYFEIKKLFKGMNNVRFQQQAGSVALSPVTALDEKESGRTLHLSTQVFDVQARFGTRTKKIQFMLAGRERGSLAAALLYNPEHWLFRSRMSKRGDFWLLKSTMARLGRQWLAGFVIASAA